MTDVTTKAEILNLLIDEAVSIDGVKDRNEIATTVFEREKLMSTGIGLSIAIPHVRLPDVKGVHTVIAINRSEITDYESLDNKPVHFLILFVAGVANQSEYIHSLALFSSVLKEPLLRKQLQYATSTKEIYSLFIKEA
jgi:mannitol/fructose-specific phosphotransferase system IIA component (Ntr-type)